MIATENNTKIEHIIDSIGVEKYKTLQQIYANESLNDLVTNKREEHKIIVGEDALYQNDDPIFNKAEGSFLSAHFYAPTKRLFGKEIDTYWANLIILWIQTVILYIILYYDLLRRFILFSRRFRFSRN